MQSRPLPVCFPLCRRHGRTQIGQLSNRLRSCFQFGNLGTDLVMLGAPFFSRIQLVRGLRLLEASTVEKQ
ncbi:MAG: hypothetical protein WCG85_03940, partial [Polyangia bacterium]